MLPWVINIINIINIIMVRRKPYTTNQETWNNILQKKLRIPMNQREYSWEANDITPFLDDIFYIFEEDKYVEKMGSIINLCYMNNNDIYDGQQRILTIILILNVIGCLSPKLKDKINALLTVDMVLDKLTPEQIKLKEHCNATIIPNIYCINPYDMCGLVNIFNNKIKSWISYVLVDDVSTSFDDEEYCCKYCHCNVSKKSNFITHISKKHEYIKEDKSTKLYNAFIEVYNYFILKRYNECRIINLYKFILNDIDIQFYDCYDPDYVSRIFDWENNRGKNVETLDVIKNPILVKISDDKKMEIYERWEEIKHKENKLYKSFGQKIFDIAIQLYNNIIHRKVDQIDQFKNIINNKNTYKEINKFFDIVDRLIKIYDDIASDRFGRLLTNTVQISLNWEAYMWCLLPIFYTTCVIDSELIKLIAKMYFRNIGFKNRTFNNLSYSTNFIRITNEVLQNNKYDYYKELEKCFIKYKDLSITNDNYYINMAQICFSSKKATYLLLFLETIMNTDIHTVSLDYTLEHIYCQKNKLNLVDKSLINNIGNLTLIEGKNSDNGHKGNSSLGSKSYSLKVKSYKRSSSIITRDLATEFHLFEEPQIKVRSAKIIELLNLHTYY